ncbi:MAG: DNA-binding transcriptional regulator, LysR family [Glomeribacter sp. 1016415]|nr:DNA-binding transcriptional regulator, LysR family [Glomeribacter sp. 1016415]
MKKVNQWKDIKQKWLDCFQEVMKHRSVSAAANYMNTVPAVVSEQIQLLEKGLGTILFERCGPKGMKPTEASEIVLKYYWESHALRDRMETSLQELGGMKRGSISIATFATYIDALMEDVINDFYHEHPTCTIGLQEIDSTPQIIAKVLEDKAHIGIIHSHYPDNSDIRCHAHAPLPINILVNNAHPLAKKRKGVLSDIAVYPIVQPPSHYNIQKIIQKLEHSEKIKLIPAFTSDSISARKKAAIAGHGGVLISSFAARHEIQANLLVPFEIDHPAFTSMEACLIVRRGRPLSPAANQLLNLIATKFSIFQQNQPNLKPKEGCDFLGSRAFSNM